MRKKMLMLMLMLMLWAGKAWGYDPPRVIGVLTSPQQNNRGFAEDFCSIGDRNGDGFDDILVNQATMPDTANEIYIFYGGEELRDEPALTFHGYRQERRSRFGVVFWGDVLGGDNPPLFSFGRGIRDVDYGIEIYRRDAEPGDAPLMELSGAMWAGHVQADDGKNTRPFDFNGDGYHDISVMRAGIGFEIYYGSADMDTIPDWNVSRHLPYWSAGSDFNGDGYDDILALLWNNADFYYLMFLGGENPDTVAAVTVHASDYAMTHYFSTLPDINGDGYDEWCAYWETIDPRSDDGYQIFLGSQEPDGVPDIRLCGTRQAIIGTWGFITGGDFNCDEYGDIITVQAGSRDRGESEEMMIHFGNRWIDDIEGEHQPDIYLEMRRAYGGRYNLETGNLGAVGDYNGDGVDDFCFGRREYLIVFAGSREWEVGVKPDEPVPVPARLELKAYPNPFNSTTTIFYKLGRAERHRLAVYGLDGRLVEEFKGRGKTENGTGRSVVWDASGVPAGIYLVRLEAAGQVQARKLVHLK
jgi:hypothetical protein